MTTSTNSKTFLDEPASLDSLSDEWREKLQKVPNYPLDYNIFLVKGIEEARAKMEGELVEFRETVLQSVPEDYGNLMFNGLRKQPNGEMKLEITTTARLQNRLLQYLILERHRRDIAMMNAALAAEPTNKEGKQISYIQLKEPLKYKIKSPLFNTFQNNKDDYAESLHKFCILQNIEYDFEHTIDENGDYQKDDDLIEAFCTDDVMNFDEKLQKSKNKDMDHLDDLVNNTEIARILLPLASQAMFLNGDSLDVPTLEETKETTNDDKKADA